MNSSAVSRWTDTEDLEALAEEMETWIRGADSADLEEEYNRLSSLLSEEESEVAYQFLCDVEQSIDSRTAILPGGTLLLDLPGEAQISAPLRNFCVYVIHGIMENIRREGSLH